MIASSAILTQKNVCLYNDRRNIYLIHCDEPATGSNPALVMSGSLPASPKRDITFALSNFTREEIIAHSIWSERVIVTAGVWMLCLPKFSAHLLGRCPVSYSMALFVPSLANL